MAFPDEIQNSAPDHPAQIMMHVPLQVVILIESVPVVISTERNEWRYLPKDVSTPAGLST